MDERTTILIVEDEREIRELMAMHFEADDFQVLTAESGQEALKTYETNASRVAAVITDTRMPNGDGLELTRQLRIRNEDLLIIVHTGSADLNKDHFVAQGANAVFFKPTDLQVIIRYIHRALPNEGAA